MAHTIKITDGTTTADFLSGNYRILAGGAGWAPRVATRRNTELAGRGPFNDVLETMSVTVFGTSESNCLANLNTLVTLLAQAESWGKSSHASPVYIEFEADGSALSNSLKSIIIGPGPGGAVILPRNFTFEYRNGRYRLGTIADPVQLSFWRQAAWLSAEETKTATGSIIPYLEIKTTSAFTETADIPSPFDMRLDFGDTIAATNGADVYALTSDQANKLFFAEAEDFTLTIGGTDTAVTAASGGYVVRFTDGVLSLNDMYHALSFNSAARRFAFWAIAKPSGTSTTWTLQARLEYSVSHSQSSQYGRTVTVKGTGPHVVALGEIVTGWEPGYLHIRAQADSTNSETLDIDYVCGIALDESANIFHVDETDGRGNGFDELYLKQNIFTTGLAQVEAWEQTAIDHYAPYAGGPYPHAVGSTVSLLVFGTEEDNGNWYLYDNDNARMAWLTPYIVRRAAYLTPL